MKSAFGVDHGEVSKSAKSEIMRLGLKNPTGPMAPGKEYFLHNRAIARQLGHKRGKRPLSRPDADRVSDIGRGNKIASDYSLSQYAEGSAVGQRGRKPGLGGTGKLPA